jgi:hypothetical protein
MIDENRLDAKGPTKDGDALGDLECRRLFAFCRGVLAP